MNTLLLDLIDKTQKGYIIRYYAMDNSKYGAIMLPIKIYEWYEYADISESNTYNIRQTKESKYVKITITKKLSPYNNLCYMKINFSNNVLYIQDTEFGKMAKAYCFQTYIDIKVYDGNSRLNYHNYRFLKNYDTRSKAAYFMDKYAHKFSLLYNKWFISDEVTYNVINKALEPFNNNIIYEHEYIFRPKEGNGFAVYTFTIVSVEKG